MTVRFLFQKNSGHPSTPQTMPDGHDDPVDEPGEPAERRRLDGPSGPEARARVRRRELSRWLFRQTMPEEVMLDLHLPIRSGLSLIRALEAVCPGVKILAHVHSRIGAPRLFALSLDGARLSMKPLPDSIADAWGERPADVN